MLVGVLERSIPTLKWRCLVRCLPLNFSPLKRLNYAFFSSQYGSIFTLRMCLKIQLEFFLRTLLMLQDGPL